MIVSATNERNSLEMPRRNDMANVVDLLEAEKTVLEHRFRGRRHDKELGLVRKLKIKRTYAH